jgi:hypothetical protein
VTTFEKVSVGLAALAIVVNLGVLVVLIFQLRGLRQQIESAADEARDRNTRERRRETMEVYAATLSKRIELRDDIDQDRDAEAIARRVERLKKAKSSEEERDAILDYLNYWEMLAAGVNEKILDYETASLIARGKIIAIYENYGPYIEWRRDTHDDSLYSELQKLAEKLEAERAQEAVEAQADN